MEETKKLFSQKSIALATYFGGPAAAGYLVKKNYEAFDQEENGMKAFIISVVSTILIFAGIFSIPEHILDNIPNALIPAVYTGIIALIVEQTQGKRIKEHKLSGGEFFSGWKAAGIGAIFLVILVVVIAGIAFISGDLTKPDFDAKIYDYKVGKFIKNEKNALEVFNEMENAGLNFLVRELDKGIVLWKEK